MKYLRRFVWYLASRLLIVCCVLGLMTTAFYFAMNATNIYIILKDGMAKRAQVIMMDDSSAELTNYFTRTYLERDDDLRRTYNGESPYINFYNITGFDHRISMTWMWCWPWDDTARATIIEKIPGIDGKLKTTMKEQATAVGLTNSPPKWRTSEYSVVLSRENGQWRIKNITLVRVITEE